MNSVSNTICTICPVVQGHEGLLVGYRHILSVFYYWFVIVGVDLYISHVT